MVDCVNAIDEAIEKHRNHDNHTCNVTVAAAEVIAVYGYETVSIVCATRVIASRDGRFSNENKKWASGIQQWKERAWLKTHPAILDGFATVLRKRTHETKPAPKLYKLDDNYEFATFDELKRHLTDFCYFDEEYDKMLDMCHGECTVAGNAYHTSRALYLLDEAAYRSGYTNWFQSVLKDLACTLDGLDEGEAYDFYGYDIEKLAAEVNE